MKQLVCEMCGSRELVKQDGYFVCQSCGLKYTVEEARKMMIEGTVEVQGTVDVQGTVTVDNRELVEKYLANARRAKKKEDWEETEKYYNLVEQNEPSNIEAIFYSSYAKARILLIETDYFKREHAFKVLGNTVSIIDENYTPGNFETLKAIGADIDGIISSNFIYKGNERDKITETYKLFCQLHVTWIESLTNIGQREEVTDEERREIYLLAVHHYEVIYSMDMMKLSHFIPDTNCIMVARNWLMEHDDGYKRRENSGELDQEIASVRKQLESKEKIIENFPISEEREKAGTIYIITSLISGVFLVLSLILSFVNNFAGSISAFTVIYWIVFGVTLIISFSFKKKLDRLEGEYGSKVISKEEYEEAKRSIGSLKEKLIELERRLAETRDGR